MRDEDDHSDQAAAETDCRRAVCALIERYDWRLLSETEWVERTLHSAPAGETPNWEKLVWRQYATVLHQACRQTADSSRREQAYDELHNFLWQAACRYWPELADDAAQRALILVFQQLDKWDDHGAFLFFAYNKLRQAFKEEQRARGLKRSRRVTEVAAADLSPGEMEREVEAEGQPPLAESLSQAERLLQLIEAILRLTNPHQQQTILWKFFEGVRDEEIAARLDITPGHVRALRSRGLTKLRHDPILRNYFVDL